MDAPGTPRRPRHRVGVWSAAASVAALTLLAGAPAASATDHRASVERAEPRVITFAGYDWQVRQNEEPLGPGPNCFSDDPDHVSVDSRGRLHLWIRRVDGRWCSSEVSNLDPAVSGYGTYRWTLASRLDRFDVNAVLGLFTWDPAATEAFNREIDIEIARWSRVTERTNAQFVVQPHAKPGNVKRFRLPEKRAGLRLTFTWAPDSITFRAPDIGLRWVYRGPDIPTPGDERVHINLWQNRGLAPSDGDPVRVVLADFEFIPRRA